MTLSEKKDIKFCAVKGSIGQSFIVIGEYNTCFLLLHPLFRFYFSGYLLLSLLFLRYDLLGEIKYLK